MNAGSLAISRSSHSPFLTTLLPWQLLDFQPLTLRFGVDFEEEEEEEVRRHRDGSAIESGKDDFASGRRCWNEGAIP